jgi:hypothetical protein
VKKLGLCAFLAGEKLDVVYEQDVHAPVPFTEIDDAIVADRIDHFVHESLGRNVGQLQIAIVTEDVLSHGMHEVRLAKPHATVDEQRVVGA